jgi:hypothetical protein
LSQYPTLTRAAVGGCDTIQAIGRDLANASLADPSDTDVLDNLAVLFGYLGDEQRQKLAAQIAGGLRAGKTLNR